MTPARLNRLVHTATAGYDAEGSPVDIVLRAEEFQSGIDITRHFLSNLLPL
jgi:hypothetical protein